MTRKRVVPPSGWADLNGPVHYLAWDGPPKGPPFVLVHGLGGSSLNWLSVGPGLAKHGPVFALDLAGFGRTPLDERSATPDANRRLVNRFVREVAGGPSIVAGNSMGGWIALLEGAVGGRDVAGLILTDPSVPHVRGTRPDPRVVALFAANFVPGLGEVVARRRAARLGPERLMEETMRLCTVNPARIDRDVYRAHVELAKERAELGYAVPAFLRAARTIVRTHLAPGRTWRLVDAVDAPTLVVHGAADRLVPVGAARDLVRRRPDWMLRVIRDVGHVPQLEAPGRWLEAVDEWLGDPLVRDQIERRRAGVKASA